MTGRGRCDGCVGLVMLMTPGVGFHLLVRLPGLQELGDQSGPAGLVRGADAASAVTVKIFVEQHVVAEVDVLLMAGYWENTGRLPCASFRKILVKRVAISRAASSIEMNFPDPVGHSILKSSP